MGWAYTYCSCGQPLAAPAIGDAVMGHLVCPECNTNHDLSQSERQMALDTFQEKQAALKLAVVRLLAMAGGAAASKGLPRGAWDDMRKELES